MGKRVAGTPKDNPRDERQKAFVDEWKELLASEANLVVRITASARISDEFDSVDRIDRMYADFIRWAGSIVGRGFLEMGERLSEVLTAPNDGFLAAWGVQNARRSWSNGGSKLSEVIMGSYEEPRELSKSEDELIEQLVSWLGSDQGAAFVSRAEERAKRYEEIEGLRSRAASKGTKAKLRDKSGM